MIYASVFSFDIEDTSLVKNLYLLCLLQFRLAVRNLFFLIPEGGTVMGLWFLLQDLALKAAIGGTQTELSEPGEIWLSTCGFGGARRLVGGSLIGVLPEVHGQTCWYLKQTTESAFLQRSLIFSSASFPFFSFLQVMEVMEVPPLIFRCCCTEMGPSGCNLHNGASLTTFTFHLLWGRDCYCTAQIPVPRSVAMGRCGEFLPLLCLKTHLFPTPMACWIPLTGRVDLNKFSIGCGYLPSFALSGFHFSW